MGGGNNIPAPKQPAPMPIEDDMKIRQQKQAEAAKIANSSGRESTILTSRRGDENLGGSGSGILSSSTPASDAPAKAILG